jgi:hypothetical protein
MVNVVFGNGRQPGYAGSLLRVPRDAGGMRRSVHCELGRPGGLVKANDLAGEIVIGDARILPARIRSPRPVKVDVGQTRAPR